MNEKQQEIIREKAHLLAEYYVNNILRQKFYVQTRIDRFGDECNYLYLWAPEKTYYRVFYETTAELFIIDEQNPELWKLLYFAASSSRTFEEGLKQIEEAEGKIRAYELQLAFQEEREPNSFFEYNKWDAFKWKIDSI